MFESIDSGKGMGRENGNRLYDRSLINVNGREREFGGF